MRYDSTLYIIMKKLFIILATIIMPFILTSCGDDKDEPKNLESQLIGEWIEDTSRYPQYLAEVIHFTFKSDHSGYEWWTYFDDKTHRDEIKFDWDIDGYYLILKGKNGYSVKTRFSINNGTLQFDDYKEKLEFIRVK